MRSNIVLLINGLLTWGLLSLQSLMAMPEVIFADGFSVGDNCARPQPAFCQPPVANRDGLHINEVRVDAIDRGLADENQLAPPLPWVELFNGADTARNLDGLSLRTAVNGVVANLPDLELPGGAFLTIYFLPLGTTAPGLGLSNDFDFSDGEGSFYADFGGQPVADSDDLALTGNVGTIGFVAWGEPLDPVSSLEINAVADGVWTAGSRIPAAQFSAGESVSLLLDGYYRNQPPALDGSHGPVAIRSADDYITIPWVEQTAGIQQPLQPLQIAPRDGQLLAAAPVTFRWRQCPDASGYLLELRDSELADADVDQFIAPGNSLTLQAADLRFNPAYWTVACLFDGNSVRTAFPPTWEFALVDTGGGGGGTPVALGVTHQYQRKDSNALCLYDFARGNRYGCAETIAIGSGCNWDGPHDVDSAADVRACGPISENNCVRASIQMTYDFLAGGVPDLHQDYISYLTFSDRNPPGIAQAAEPEGDLGAGVGMTRGETRTALAKVLGVDGGDILIEEDPSFSDIRGWIDAGRPVILFRWWRVRGGHATVVYGYRTEPFGAVLVHDPTDGPGLSYRYSRYSRQGLRTLNPLTAIVPPATIGTPFGDPPNADHSGSLFADLDGDGVVSFDELERFKTDPTNFDSDYDQVAEIDEVHSYTFALGLSTIVSRRPDIDGDSFRAELDCNTDNDGRGDLDGGEDINSDGGHLVEPVAVGPGETNKFIAGGMNDDLTLTVFPDKGPPGTTFTLSGGTLNGSYSYNVEAVDCLSPKSPGDALGGIPWGTNSSGNGIDDVFTCPRPGCWILYMDLADDAIWQDPAPAVPASVACDVNFTVNCECSPGDGGDDSLRLDDSSLVIPENNEIDDIQEIVISRYNPDPLELTIVTTPGTGGNPPVHDWNLIFQVQGQPGSQQSNFTNGGFLWGQLQFDQNGQLINPPQWQIWDGANWQPEPLTGPGPFINDQIMLMPMVQIELVELQLASIDPVVMIAGQPQQLQGMRVITFGQDLNIGNPGAIVDGMPDLQPQPGNTPVGQNFVSFNTCPN
ncbi:MAG: hypothetical protein Tsb002_14900 [Wenzhouxiangellaceae bacterium]